MSLVPLPALGHRAQDLAARPLGAQQQLARCKLRLVRSLAALGQNGKDPLKALGLIPDLRRCEDVFVIPGNDGRAPPLVDLYGLRDKAFTQAWKSPLTKFALASGDSTSSCRRPSPLARKTPSSA